MDLQNLTTKQKVVILVILSLVCALYLVFTKLEPGIYSGDKSVVEENFVEKSISKEEKKPDDNKYYEITGQVNSPGVYEGRDRMMVIELISLAGGFTDSADLYIIHKDISLSTIVEDRQKIYIPALFERGLSSNLSGVQRGQTNGKVSINNATSQELESLPDIGPATSAKIIGARPFTNIEELKKVQGIGDKTYNNIISLISL